MHKFVSIDRIFTKLVRDVGKDFNESDVIEWTGEALEFMETPRTYEDAVAFIEVKDYQCELPDNMHGLLEVARNNRWTETNKCVIPNKLINTLKSCCTTKSDKAPIPVAINCEGEPENAYDLAYYRPYFDLKWEYQLWRTSSYYTQEWTPISPSQHSFFDAIILETPNNVNNIYQCDSTSEYKIINGTHLRFSFRSGFVAIAYSRAVLDPTNGYPMVPDSISHTTAIVSYITWKILDRDCIMGREGACSKADRAEKQWQWYCGQASNKDLMPETTTDLQNIHDSWNYILPRNKYYGFFGKLNKPENRLYNDSNLRNKRLYTFYNG